MNSLDYLEVLAKKALEKDIWWAQDPFHPATFLLLINSLKRATSALNNISVVASVSARPQDGEIKDILYEADTALTEISGMLKKIRDSK